MRKELPKAEKYSSEQTLGSVTGALSAAGVEKFLSDKTVLWERTAW
jgi:hypothetical protein